MIGKPRCKKEADGKEQESENTKEEGAGEGRTNEQQKLNQKRAASARHRYGEEHERTQAEEEIRAT